MNGNNGNYDRHIKAFEAEDMSLESRQQVLGDLLALVMKRCVNGSESQEYCAKRLPYVKVDGLSGGWVDLVTFKTEKPKPHGPDALVAGITQSEWDPEPQGDKKINKMVNYLFSRHFLIFETAEEQRQIRTTECRMVPAGIAPAMGPSRLHRHELSFGHPERTQKLATVAYEEVVFLRNLLDPTSGLLTDPAAKRSK